VQHWEMECSLVPEENAARQVGERLLR